MKPQQKPLPYGVCRTVYYNACDRKDKRPEKARACFMAYCGSGPTYQCRRFMIDRLGEDVALTRAIRWRERRAPLDRRSCDDKRRCHFLPKNLTRLIHAAA